MLKLFIPFFQWCSPPPPIFRVGAPWTPGTILYTGNFWLSTFINIHDLPTPLFHWDHEMRCSKYWAPKSNQLDLVSYLEDVYEWWHVLVMEVLECCACYGQIKCFSFCFSSLACHVPRYRMNKQERKKWMTLAQKQMKIFCCTKVHSQQTVLS